MEIRYIGQHQPNKVHEIDDKKAKLLLETGEWEIAGGAPKKETKKMKKKKEEEIVEDIETSAL